MSPSNLNTPSIPSSSVSSASLKLRDFKQSVKLKYAKIGYHYLITHGMYLFLSPLFVLTVAQLCAFSLQDLHDLWDQLRLNLSLISVVLCSALLVFLLTLYFLTRPQPVYLVDFSCYMPEEAQKVTRRVFMNSSHSIGTFTEENLAFERKILERSGLGESTYLPEAVVQVPPSPCMAEARTQNSDYVFN